MAREPFAYIDLTGAAEFDARIPNHDIFANMPLISNTLRRSFSSLPTNSSNFRSVGNSNRAGLAIDFSIADAAYIAPLVHMPVNSKAQATLSSLRMR